MMKNNQIIGLLVAVVAIVGGIIYLSKDKVGPARITSAPVDVVATSVPVQPIKSQAISSNKASSDTARIAEKALKYERAKEIASPSGFVNTDGKPITLGQYVGKKVILLDVMTYSCINCIRTYPYLNDWYTKYEDKGLVIIGIHTPEFDFEKNIDNVKAAMAKYGIKFPVVLDNDYGTWNAYNNHYWPMKYLIDIDGFVRFTHIGEGGYEETEKDIQGLLKERGEVLGTGSGVVVKTTADTAGSPVAIGQSPETYLGSNRNEFFGNGKPGEAGSASYTVPAQLVSDRYYLDGAWTISADHAENTSVPARIVYRFSAKHAYLVASADTPVKVDISVDGARTGSVTIAGAQLYDIYSGDAFGTHTIELAPQEKGLKAFTFTFGN